jgi:hypothetical protein
MALKNLQSLVRRLAHTRCARRIGRIERGFSMAMADGRAMLLSLPRHWSPKPADLDPDNPTGRQRLYGVAARGTGRSPRLASVRASSRLTFRVRGLRQVRTAPNQRTTFGSTLRSMPAAPVHG